MPKYRNKGSQPIYLEHDKITINPGEEKEVYYFYDYEDLELLDVKPYNSPIERAEIITLTIDPVEIDVFGKNFIIYPVNKSINIHLNEYPSDKSFTQLAGTTFQYTNTNGLIYKLYLEQIEPNTQVYILIYSKYNYRT